jgi:Na+-transporting NADH:ubiquinone oxidoreductase subunit C
MTPEARRREQARTLGFMLALTGVMVAAVAGSHLLTAERVAMNESLFLKKAILRAAGLTPPGNAAEVAALYASRVRETASGEFRVVSAAGDAAVARVVLERGRGLWGAIRAAVGFEPEGSRMTGLDFLEQGETPGLGARIEEPWFKAQFRGRRGPFKLAPEGTSRGDGEFDAITGATVTSEGVRDLVNSAAARAAGTAATSTPAPGGTP